MVNIVSKIQLFYEETVKEIKKCSWPSRSELFDSTNLVIIALIFLTLFIGAVDFVSQQSVRFFILR